VAFVLSWLTSLAGIPEEEPVEVKTDEQQPPDA
jgi:hypothetical protein